ncbi:peptidase [Rheinheimera riviphila]|uniref:Peptidase n=1 Tax=Rheinheimera riviphila TaxID=1834037 RepID=A0A437QMN8_9GAMM|nr:M48 family metallopeptidase [Rheinheimera riviphila]RVU35700.1 peptidase [Rheinheimera riviphila]
MAVDFFKAQDEARRNTKLLVLLFGLAVFCLLILTNILLLITLGFLNPEQSQLLFSPSAPNWWSALPWPIMAWTSLGIVLLIGIVVAIKRAELRQGGQVVAKALGGIRLDHQIADPKQRMLLNVVEEMAIAAGVPVPPVYLMPEAGINAFAAGYAPADAVIGITEGCLQQLNRDQLQGVIAHEFSHILNGDMRMNIRLIALLQGILFIGHAGYYLLRSGGRTAAAVSIGSSRSKNSNGGGIFALALGLMVLGYLGSFFGNLIKAAVSRQREFLADASAVQFTRNPQGIAGALKAIGAVGSRGSRVKHPNADEMSHLFFGEAISRWTSLFATHPPLAERIKRIDPSWLGKFPQAAEPPTSNFTDSANQNNDSGHSAAAKPATGSQAVQHMLAAIPALLLHSSRHAPSAPALVCACLIQPEHLARQLHFVKELGSAALLADVDRLYDQVSQLTPRQKLQLLQLVIPALKQQTSQQFLYLQQLVEALVSCDGQQDLLEWSLMCWLEHCVGSQFDPDQIYRGDRASRLSQVEAAALALLSVCTRLVAEPATQQQAWQAGLTALGLPATTVEPAADLVHLKTLLPQLIQTAPMLKKQLWQMVQAAIMADENLSQDEGLLADALALLLEVPKPDLLR